jgi:hypothetical protein
VVLTPPRCACRRALQPTSEPQPPRKARAGPAVPGTRVAGQGHSAAEEVAPRSLATVDAHRLRCGGAGCATSPIPSSSTSGGAAAQGQGKRRRRWCGIPSNSCPVERNGCPDAGFHTQSLDSRALHGSTPSLGQPIGLLSLRGLP